VYNNRLQKKTSYCRYDEKIPQFLKEFLSKNHTQLL
jgi:hypothetical protein